MAYLGNIPAEKYQTISSQQITGNGGSSYSLTYSVSSPEDIAVFVNNVRQNVNSYSVSLNTLTLGGNISASDECWVLYLGKTISTVAPANNSVTNDMLVGSIATSKISNLYPYRNLIINGDMSIAQRGTSATGLTGTGFACDRFQFASSGTIGTYTLSQSTTTPDEFAYSLKLDTTTADASPTGTDNLTIRYKIEGQHLQHLAFGTSSAKSITLSFWCRSNKTGNFQVNVRNQDANRMISSVVTISSADTWEYKTITFAGDTVSGFNNDNGESLRIEWFLDVGTDWSTGTAPTSWETTSAGDLGAGVTLALADNTANEFYLTGVQLEVGTSASDFEFLPYDVNLQRCHRYYWKETSSPNAGGQWTAVGGVSQTNTSRVMMFLPTSMRTIPTSLGTSGTASHYRIQYRNTGEICNAVPSFVTANYDRIQFNLSTAASMTVGEYCALRYASANTGYLEVDVEL